MTIDQIISKYYQEFIKFAVHLSGDFHKGNDLVQDAIIKGIENEETFEHLHQAQVKAWFFRTIKNKYIDDYRKSKREVLLASDKLDQYDRIYEDFENKAVLQMILLKLPKDMRSLIRQRYIEGYSSREIAHMNGSKASTVRNHLSKGIQMLRRVYEEDK